MGNTTSVYPQGSGRPKSACSNYQAKGDKFSAILHSGYQFQQGFGRLSSRHSRHTGAGLGSYTHNSQAENLAEVSGMCNKSNSSDSISSGYPKHREES